MIRMERRKGKTKDSSNDGEGMKEEVILSRKYVMVFVAVCALLEVGKQRDDERELVKYIPMGLAGSLALKGAI